MTNVTPGSGEGGRGDRPRRPAPDPAWPVEWRQGSAASLLAWGAPAEPATRAVRVPRVDAPAIVLGSTQADHVEWTGVEVVRRRSGGGAVLLRPGETVWVDVVVPKGDALWADDVSRAFWWLGEVWAAALGRGEVHRGPLVSSRWSGEVCFAGVGAGEVVADGAKVVGIAARRTRSWALFQCAVPLVWDAAAYVSALGLPAAAAGDLAGVASPVPGMTESDVVDAFVAALPG